MKTEPVQPEAFLASLEEAARDFLFPSESDYPLTPFRWEGAALSPEALIAAQGLAADTPVETTGVDDFFAPVLTPPDSPEAERYRRIVELLKGELSDLRVHRVGRIEIDVYVLGRHASGAWLGLRTKVIET